MTSHTAPSTGSARSLRRPAVLGFVIGFLAAFVVTMLALVTVVAEAVHPVLVPAAPLLRPIADRMADWPGLVNMVIAGTVNGAVYAAAFVLVALVLRRGRGA
ncbi:hypothetical protein [Nocardioides iriomotensis]|uniref:Uncharacterized protein n=1 Tax=Nocardioides iriomotensis TaxID=715784 RepID=A0A4Q5J3M0_9ACTN|nr:hypothetical protein [Nocardioides iriomotensis]RYU13013.1 hypothetical protein ETU37_08730 [Nocardioides iriomotensis]